MKKAYQVKRDGEVKYTSTDEFKALKWLQDHTSYSHHHAVKHEGWSIEKTLVKTAISKPTRFDWFCPDCDHKEQSFAWYQTCKCNNCGLVYALEHQDINEVTK